MREKITHATLFALTLGVATPALMAGEEIAFDLDGIAGEATSLPLRSFPVGVFSGLQHLQFQQQGIVTAADLIDADPELIGRIMGMDPREIAQVQQHLSEVMVED